uniref:Uncharacterized protein n=1 Tax=Triticum urartu TaxID=4572 RepID=A0A8R7QG36_TRIUA
MATTVGSRRRRRGQTSDIIFSVAYRLPFFSSFVAPLLQHALPYHGAFSLSFPSHGAHPSIPMTPLPFPSSYGASLPSILVSVDPGSVLQICSNQVLIPFCCFSITRSCIHVFSPHHPPANVTPPQISFLCYKPASSSRCESSTSRPRWVTPRRARYVSMLILLFSRIIAAWEWVFFICDHHGCCVLACNERFEGVTSPELAEVVAWPLGSIFVGLGDS